MVCGAWSFGSCIFNEIRSIVQDCNANNNYICCLSSSITPRTQYDDFLVYGYFVQLRTTKGMLCNEKSLMFWGISYMMIGHS